MSRENRCGNEIRMLLAGGFFLYTAIQLFCNGAWRPELVRGISRILYLTVAPGFAFYLGCRFGWDAGALSEEEARRRNLWASLCCCGFFFFLAFAWEVILAGNGPLYALNRVLTLLSVPALSAPFFSMFLLQLFVWLFFAPVLRLTSDTRRMAAVGAVCLLCAFLRPAGESYALVAALFGDARGQAVGAVCCFAFFLMGAWVVKREKRLTWKPVLASVLGTGASLLLYSTPLRPLCRVTVSLFPVCVLYAAAGRLAWLGTKLRGLCMEWSFWLGTACLFALRYLKRDTLGPGYGLKKTFVLAAAVFLAVCGAVFLFQLLRFLYGAAADGLSGIKHKTAAYFAIYTAVFAFLLLLVFSPFLAAGRDLLWRTDGITQYYPKAVYFARYIRELISSFLKGDFTLPMYDFSIGMGSAVTYSLEPLYFLYALFGEEHAQLAYNVITVLRFYLAGIAASVFMLYFRKDYFSTFIASVTYVFCGFALYGGARHTMFMIPMILLPFLILSVEEILRRRRWYLCTVFVAVSLLSSYYYLYMNTIAMGIYFLVRFFCRRDKQKRRFREFIGRGLVICGSYLLGVGMSCIVLATTFGMYVSSGRSSTYSISTPSLFYYGGQWIVRCFMSFLTTANSPGEWLKLGFLPISLIAVAFLFARKGRRELKILSVIGLLMMIFPAAGFVFSGFNSVINRWCYMLALLVAYIVADCLPDMRRMGRRDLLVCGTVAGVYGFLAFFGDILSTRYTKQAFLLLAVTFGALLAGQDRVKSVPVRTKQFLMLILTVVAVFHSGFSLFYMDEVTDEYTKAGRAQSKVEDTPLAAVSRIEDDSFYRVSALKMNYYSVCSSLLLGYNGITQFSSTINDGIIRYMEEMGSTSYSMTQLLGFGNRTFLNLLASVKYCAVYDGARKSVPYGYEDVLHTTVNDQETTVYENRYALPLGYTYSEAISEEELEQYSTLERQEVLLQKVLLNGSENTGNTDAQVTLERVEPTGAASAGISLSEDALTVEDPKGEITLQFESLPDSETCLVFRNARVEDSEDSITLTFQSEGNSLEYRFRTDADRYSAQQEDYVINLGYHAEAITSCTILANKAGTVSFDSLEVYSQPMENLGAYAEALTEDVLENVQMETNQITGEIRLEEDKILVLSIPYQKGWTAWVDGVETPLERANYMYMALELSGGEHTIELKFEIPGVKYALIIMPASAVLFGILCAASYRRRRKRRIAAET